MLTLKDSDLFNSIINKDNVIFGKINLILSDKTGKLSGAVILNNILYPDIKRKIVDRQKNPMITKMANAIVNGKMVLFALPPEKNLPDVIPFFTYKKDGVRQVAVNLTSVVYRTKDDADNIIYDLADNVDKVYAILYSAYLALDVFEDNAIMSHDTLYYAAVIWADIFTKPLYASFGMHNNDRNKALKYFAMKFFLGYYMQCSENQIDELTKKFIDKKNPLILYMEDKIYEKGYNLYEGFIPFCRILFDAEVTMTKGIRVNNLENTMNVTTYIQSFSSRYHKNALMMLCSFPYFIYVLIAASSKCNIMKDKSFDSIFKDEGTMLSKLLLSILR